MKEFTLGCLLLSLFALSLAAGPPPQSNRQTSGESRCSAGFKACQESLNDFKEAKEFMQLKASVLADLDRTEKSKPTKSRIAIVRNASVYHQKSGNEAVSSATVGPNRTSSAQAATPVQPVLVDLRR
jgi:hypothetical protein